MLLEEIHLRHFGSYDDATIDLRGLTAAVVLGPNGAGKSTAFIDAVLWALYGQARSSTDHMLKTGETDMTVVVTFRLNQQRYRVIRKRSLRTKAGKSDLDLQVDRDGTWAPFGAGRVAETQAQIVTLLHCDHSLLTATSFFLQGQADRFSRATPAERKTILAGILRLDHYADLKQRAGQELTRLDSRRAAKWEQLQALTDLDETLAAHHRQARELTDGIQYAEQEHHAADQAHAALRDQITALKGQLATLPDLQATLETDRATVQPTDTKLQALLQRHERWSKITRNAPVIREKLEAHRATSSVIAALERTLQDREPDLTMVRDQVAHAQRGVADLQALEALSRDLRHQIETAATAYQRETADLTADQTRDTTQAALLTQVPCGQDLQGRCQFTTLAVAAHARILPREQRLAGRPQDWPAIVALVAPDQAVEQVKLEAQIQEARRANWTGIVAERQAVLRDLEQHHQRDRQTLAQKKGLLPELERFTVLLPELELAERELPGIAAEINSLTASITQLRQRITDQTLAIARLQQIPTTITTLEQRAQDARARITTIQRHQTTLSEQLGATRAAIQHTEEALASADSLRADLAALELSCDQYRTLQEAYGLIPTFMMENALPIVEQETNALLARISRTGMQVRFDTQKALKSRDGLAETLEIVVRDQVGERPLENYSGGERFRLDLAQRIGLSKLLARRAGARIETLAIDEGLGSLDEDGLLQLQECLGALGDDFKLVLVITHVDQMKATFPSQIMITKDHQGSHAEVLT